ncbi:4-diphosphocytidyl-2-C-methyl-D-erythritol kinase [Secundilactobacillus oryzae JCM 18671]|uniref:4-diphosphocytidyl-2-C-methyl-D-erythritol kinase n=1 Tax=Secundilactobacillus oryzae JCM 18671 TaxID=1291743 RepID=A0A081BH61_9LACO|nr:4-(cytidine 5'-diphospho)-2-C-methyl-D-erythritol kinase [Secundilactobacillus oryzae]GAK47379.1 4-diphosphocytidyl-2-C-methyl-D-erythritol kinase [Secundilactobacillus oryzae JCM 18671]
MRSVEKAPAKINLGLDTPYNHRDGLQEWNMVMTSIDLADYVEVTTLPDENRIHVTSDSGFLPNDQRNLAYQAARVLKERFSIDEGVDIVIHKHIPVAAGLGGGSTDAAAVLRALNKIWGLNLALPELAAIGLEVDSDVPYCVYGQTAHVFGKGEKVTPIKKLPPCWIVLAKPRVSVSTPTVLRQIDYDHLSHPDVESLVSAIYLADFEKIVAAMGNVLEPITAERYPEILKLKSRMLDFGADAAQMSGTGPTVFGIFQKKSRAQRVFNSIKGFCDEVYLVRPL